MYFSADSVICSIVWYLFQCMKSKNINVQLDNVVSLTPKVHALAIADRDLYSKGILAFVSYVRGYKEHQCSYIFQASKLKYGGLASGFGLLHLPKMPELRGKDMSATFTRVNVDLASIPYVNKAREEHRQLQVAKDVANKKGKEQMGGDGKPTKEGKVKILPKRCNSEANL